MENKVLLIFLLEIERQASFGMMASSDLDNALKGMNLDRIWYSTQSLLIAAANLSKLFWPGNKKAALRGRELREFLGLAESSPLKPRTLRNLFEHYDEWIDSWAITSLEFGIIDSNISPTGKIAGMESKNAMRNFDTDQYAVTFQGEIFLLRPILHEIKLLHLKVIPEINKLLFRLDI